MKLISPSLKIDPQKPFSSDLFERQIYGDSLRNLISRVDDSIVVTLEASWGEGKTTFLRMWQADLKLQGIQSIYFDAFEHDYSDDPFLDIVSEICSFVDEEFADSVAIIEPNKELKSKASVVCRRLLGWSAKVAVKAATLGAIKDSDIEDLEAIGKDISKDAGDITSQLVNEKINSHSEEKRTLYSFKKSIETLGKAIKKSQGFPLMIVIDELDRCRPSYAIEVIEKIKHLFSAENVVFLLAVNTRQLQESIKSVYGAIDANTYLKKFVNIETQLPRRYGYTQINDYTQYASYLFDAHEFEQWLDKGALVSITSCFGEYYKLSLRDIERVFTNLAIHYISVKESTLNLIPIIALLAVCRVQLPEVFLKLKDKKLTYDEFNSELELTGIPKNYYTNVYPEYFVTCFKYCLFSDADYHNEDSSSEIKHMNIGPQYRIGRNEIIPWYCSSIEAFSFNAN
jgi:hypothetical protein